jgi:hypothetical protein
VIQDPYGVLLEKLVDLAAQYSLTLEGERLLTYLVALMTFSLTIAIAAIEAAAVVSAASFPEVTDLVGLCEGIVENVDREVFSSATLAPYPDHKHEYEIEAEPTGGQYSGFEVCKSASVRSRSLTRKPRRFSRPVFERALILIAGRVRCDR